MRIGVISDTHDDLRAIEQALEVLRAEDVAILLHCGDLCSPAALEALSGFDAWVARGNMDRHPGLAAAARHSIGSARLAELHRLTLDGQAAALLHGHRQDDLRGLVSAGLYAYIFHGHTHCRRDQRIGTTRVINPGALGGIRWQQRSFCILDLTADRVDFVKI